MIVALIGLLVGTDARSEEMMQAGALRPLPAITEENAARVKEGMTIRQVLEILGPQRNEARSNSVLLIRGWGVIAGPWLDWVGKESTVSVSFDPQSGQVTSVECYNTIIVKLPIRAPLPKNP